MLATTVKQNPADWENHLRKVCLAYNSTTHSTTGYSPFYLMFGHQVRLPIDILMYEPDVTVGEFANTMRQQLRNAYKQVRQTTQQRHLRQKDFYIDVTLPTWRWLFSDVIPRGQNKKLHHPWTGPFKELQKLSDVTYRLQRTSGRCRKQVVHFDRLKPYHPVTTQEIPPSKVQPSLAPDPMSIVKTQPRLLMLTVLISP